MTIIKKTQANLILKFIHYFNPGFKGDGISKPIQLLAAQENYLNIEQVVIYNIGMST